jgi:hypothetical protein
MLKKIATLAAFAAALGVGAANARANTIAGRVTSFSPTSITVLDKEAVTIGLNRETAFTKLIVQKPWQENTQLAFSALAVGRYVVVHANNGVATWVQVNTDRTFFVKEAFTTVEPSVVVPSVFSTEAARHRAEAAALRRAPNPAESKRPGSPGTAAHCERIAARLEAEARIAPAYAAPAATASPAAIAQAKPGDLLASKEVQDLIANAKTPADHLKLARHFTALAARYDAEAVDHAAEAKAYRSGPNAAESKRPSSPGTAAHCDRLAKAAREAATAARDLANDHEKMAK